MNSTPGELHIYMPFRDHGLPTHAIVQLLSASTESRDIRIDDDETESPAKRSLSASVTPYVRSRLYADYAAGYIEAGQSRNMTIVHIGMYRAILFLPIRS